VKTLRVLSLGAGVQSTTIALMIEKGELPMVDGAVFSDTGGEPKDVYDHLAWLEKQLSYPVYKVQWRNLKEDILDAADGKLKKFTVPFYTLDKKTNKRGSLLRQCTRDYKVRPVTNRVREMMGYQRYQHVDKTKWKVEMLIGISNDEMQRVKKNILKYAENVYPLIEKDMSRNDCLAWMKKNNYPEPPRSACTFCPYHSNKEWHNLKKNQKEWDEVIKMDRLIRNTDENKKSQIINNEMFLHYSCKPLDEINFDEKLSEQFALDFADECEGMCGN
jgi:hypothetical protein|tara:strand:- start:367 stop:1191 length:825 start_codon:yes stop_codon:yes gene_type:complete